jgi:hypothetical protein
MARLCREIAQNGLTIAILAERDGPSSPPYLEAAKAGNGERRQGSVIFCRLIEPGSLF